jgi:hypothetical protein
MCGMRGLNVRAPSLPPPCQARWLSLVTPSSSHVRVVEASINGETPLTSRSSRHGEKRRACDNGSRSGGGGGCRDCLTVELAKDVFAGVRMSAASMEE